MENNKFKQPEVKMGKTLLTCLVVLGCFFAMPLVSQDTVEGKWTAELKNDKIFMSMKIAEKTGKHHDWNFCEIFKKSDFPGLQRDKEHTFKFVKEAGTISFNGKFSEKSGSGNFTFAPDKKFVTFLESKGFDGITGKKMLVLCLQDVTSRYVNDLFKLGYSGISLSRLIAFAVHDITVDYIKKVRELGFSGISADKLIAFAVHDISSDYIKGIHKVGYSDISADKLIAFSVHDISIDYIKDIHSLGYKDISPSKLISFRIHDIDKEYIKHQQSKRKEKLSANKIISLKIHED